MTELPADSASDVEFTTSNEPPPEAASWFLERKPAGQDPAFMSTARVHGGYLLRIDDVFFKVEDDGCRIVGYLGHQPFDAIEQLLVDQVLPQALHLRGQVSLHASAVVIASGAVAFLGNSGDGKSTLASAFVPPDLLLADDALTLALGAEAVLAFPAYPSVRLRADSAARFGHQLGVASSRMTWKRRVPLALTESPTPLRRVFLLAVGPDIRIDPLNAARGLAEVARFVHRLDPSVRTALLREFEVLSTLAQRVPIRQLSYPRDFALLPSVVRAVRRDLEKSP